MYDTRIPSPLIETTVRVLTALLDRPDTAKGIGMRLDLTERRAYRQIHYVRDMGFKVYKTDDDVYTIDFDHLPPFVQKIMKKQKLTAAS